MPESSAADANQTLGNLTEQSKLALVSLHMPRPPTHPPILWRRRRRRQQPRGPWVLIICIASCSDLWLSCLGFAWLGARAGVSNPHATVNAAALFNKKTWAERKRKSFSHGSENNKKKHGEKRKNNNNKKGKVARRISCCSDFFLLEMKIGFRFFIWRGEALFTIYPTFGIWQQITHEEQKDSAMKLHYSGSQGRRRGLMKGLRERKREREREKESTPIVVHASIREGLQIKLHLVSLPARGNFLSFFFFNLSIPEFLRFEA